MIVPTIPLTMPPPPTKEEVELRKIINIIHSASDFRKTGDVDVELSLLKVAIDRINKHIDNG